MGGACGRLHQHDDHPKAQIVAARTVAIDRPARGAAPAIPRIVNPGWRSAHTIVARWITVVVLGTCLRA
jgi:hypothetical protein